MPDLILKCGQAVFLDDEDYDYALDFRWFVWFRTDRSIRVARDEYAGGRVFRVFLHREIAVRMHPHIAYRAHRMKVWAKNGDYTDVRRENLEVIFRKSHGGGNVGRKPLGADRTGTRIIRSKGTIDERDLPAKSPCWNAGIVNIKRRVNGAARHSTRVFLGRVVVEPDGHRGPALCGHHAGPRDAEGGDRGDPAGSDEVLLLTTYLLLLRNYQIHM